MKVTMGFVITIFSVDVLRHTLGGSQGGKQAGESKNRCRQLMRRYDPEQNSDGVKAGQDKRQRSQPGSQPPGQYVRCTKDECDNTQQHNARLNVFGRPAKASEATHDYVSKQGMEYVGSKKSNHSANGSKAADTTPCQP